MDYLEYKSGRSLVKNLDILAFEAKKSDPISGSISFLTKSKYSHVAMALWAHDRLWAVESEWPRVVIKPMSKRISQTKTGIDVYRYDIPDIDKGIKYLLDHVFVPYDIIGVIKFALAIWLKRTPNSDDKALFCSELAALVLKNAGVEIQNPAFVSPGNLAVKERFIFKLL